MIRSTSFARPVPPPATTSPPVSAGSPHQPARGAGGGQGFESAKYRRDFKGDGSDFSATRECETWLKARGFSFGPMQRGAPTAVVFGDCTVAKWWNLSPEDHADIHGIFTGSDDSSFRHGPVVLVIRRDAPSAVIEAFLSDDEADKAAQAQIEGRAP